MSPCRVCRGSWSWSSSRSWSRNWSRSWSWRWRCSRTGARVAVGVMQVEIIRGDGWPGPLADEVDGRARAPVLKAPTSAFGYALRVRLIVGATHALRMVLRERSGLAYEDLHYDLRMRAGGPGGAWLLRTGSERRWRGRLPRWRSKLSFCGGAVEDV